MSKTVSILPETDSTTLCVELTGTVTARDYTEIFKPSLQALADKDSRYNLLIVYAPEFTGWDEDAADLSFKNMTHIAPKARKLAYVNPPDSKILSMKLLQGITPAEIRFFDEGQTSEAIAWLKE